MDKKLFFSPVVLSGGGLTPEDGDETGHGTAQSTTDPYACDYDEWILMFEIDMNNDQLISYADYVLWMNSYGWGDQVSPSEDPGY